MSDREELQRLRKENRALKRKIRLLEKGAEDKTADEAPRTDCYGANNYFSYLLARIKEKSFYTRVEKFSRYFKNSMLVTRKGGKEMILYFLYHFICFLAHFVCFLVHFACFLAHLPSPDSDFEIGVLMEFRLFKPIVHTFGNNVFCACTSLLDIPFQEHRFCYEWIMWLRFVRLFQLRYS